MGKRPVKGDGGGQISSLRLPPSRKRSHDGILLADQTSPDRGSPAESSLGSLFESAQSHQESDDHDDAGGDSDPGEITGLETGEDHEAASGNGSSASREANENHSATVNKSNQGHSAATAKSNDDHSATTETPNEEAAAAGRERQEQERQGLERQERAKHQLVHALEHIDELSFGSYATHGCLPKAFNPGLGVAGLGNIGLPLSVHDAQRLIPICHRVHVGGVGAVANSAVGRIWELYPTNLMLRNPLWSQTVDEMVAKVTPALGIAPDGSDVRAELQRLYLYEQGATTELRKDPPQPTAVFGTLVIILPSAHKGGAVAAVSGESIQLLESSPNAEFDTSYLAWHTNGHTNVEHALQQVTAGFRLVLKYNLVYANEAVYRQAVTNLERRKEVSLALSSLRPSAPDDRSGLSWPLAFMLDYQYPEANFQINHLVRLDAVRAKILQQACKETGFAICLANTLYTISGSCAERQSGRPNGNVVAEHIVNHDIINEYGRSFRLLTVWLTNGRECTKNLDFKEGNILQSRWYANKVPESQKFQKNEVPSTIHYYRNSCFLILPQNRYEDFVLDMMARSPSQAEKLLLALIEETDEAKPNAKKRRGRKRLGIGVETDPSIGSPRERLQRLCKIVLYNAWFTESLVTAAITMNDVALMQTIASCPGFIISDRTFHNIGYALPFGLSLPDRWKEAIALTARKHGDISKTWAALAAVKAGFMRGLDEKRNETGEMPEANVKSLESMGEWSLLVFADSLRERHPVGDGDAQAFFLVSRDLSNREQFFAKAVLPFVKKHIRQTAFVLSFLDRLGTASTDGGLPKEYATDVYKGVFNSLLPELLRNIDARLDPTSVQPVNGQPPNPHNVPGSQVDFSTPDQLFAICGQCLRLGLEDELRTIFDELAQRSDRGPPEVLHLFHVPFLNGLVASMSALPEDKLLHYRPPTKTIIDNYMQRYVGTKPVLREDWSTMEALGCGQCDPCKEVDEFLADAEKTSGQFVYTNDVYNHLCERLPGNMYTSTGWISTSDTASAYALKIEKRADENKSRGMMRHYASKRKTALALIESFNLPLLSRLLDVPEADLTSFYPAAEQAEDETLAREDAARDQARRAEAALQAALQAVRNSRTVPFSGPAAGTVPPGESEIIDLTHDAAHPMPLAVPLPAEQTHGAWSYLSETDPVQRLDGACKVHSYTAKFSVYPSPWVGGGPTASYHGHLLMTDHQGKMATAFKAEGELPFRSEEEVKRWLAEKAWRQMFGKGKYPLGGVAHV